MIKLTITEKLWDAVRPGSVKKTGISESVRSTMKVLPSGAPDTPKAFDNAIAAIGDLGAALSKGETAVKAAKDDKKGAAAKLKGWREECEKAVSSLTRERVQLGILKSGAEADTMMKALQTQVEDAIRDADQCIKDVASGKLKDPRQAMKQLQEFRTAMRDGLKATQKDGFKAYIATIKPVLDWQVDPADVPLPPVGKAIKDRLPVLEAAAEKARVAVEGLLDASASGRDQDVAAIASGLIKDYRKLAAGLKSEIPVAKKFGTTAKEFGSKFKDLIAQGTTQDKLLPSVQRLHDAVMAFEEKSLKELARGRVSSGDLQARRIKLRDGLKDNMDQYKQFEAMVGDEWNLCMVVYREISEQVAVAHRQVERVLRLVGEIDQAAANEADQLAKRYDDEAAAMRRRYG